MLVPLSWLREFTPFEGTAQQLGDKLTMLGLELEDVQHPFAHLAGIKVGFVAECQPMPDSDHLHCCKVDVGAGELLDIVCGAPNVAQGQMVPVAPVGFRMPDGTQIKKGKLRGHVSNGMICSERELGLSDDHAGIMVLPASVTPGVSMFDALEMERDVLDLSVTPNRADCLSILGIARETAMAFHLPLHVPELPLIPQEPSTGPEVAVSIADPALCWLYAGRVIAGVKVAQAPWRMRFRLISVGVRPISNVVDVTNYVLFECGQPLHAFDLDKLAGRRIDVRTAAEGTRFTTLDGKERTLAKADLCICDDSGTVALAGVMGGLESEISPESRNVFLESAVFKPQSIRRTSRRLGLGSEASYRFERGVDEQRSIWALNRAATLIASICGGIAQPQLSLEEPRPFNPHRISFRPARCESLLGVELSAEFQAQALESVGCGVERDASEKWTVIQPSWRPDLTREADLVEEVGRIYGLDEIAPKLPCIQRSLDTFAQNSPTYAFWQKIKEWGAGIGLNEAINYSFVGTADLDLLNLPSEERIHIFNPLSEDQNVLRTRIAPGLLNTLAFNIAHGAHSLHVFELANTFTSDPRSETGAHEQGALGIMLYGSRHEPAWPYREEDMGYPDLKGLVENLFQFLHLDSPVYALAQAHPYFAPCVQMVSGNEAVGVVGRVQPKIAQQYHAQKEVWLAELDLHILHKLHVRRQTRFSPLPAFPAVRRDMTVEAPRSLQAGDVLAEIMAMKLPLLEGAVLLDCYEPEDKHGRNLTFRLTFRHATKTLKDSEADRERNKIATSLVKKLGVVI